MGKKVLVLYAPLGAGHFAAAKAIVETFELNYSEIEIKNVNVLDFAFDIFKQGLPFAFTYVASKIPVLYKWIYNYCNHQSRYKYLNHTSDAIMRKSKFVKFIKDFNPDFILSTNPLPMQLVSKTKQKNIIDIMSANVCTDFGFHSLWHNPDVNYYFISNEEIKNKLLAHNVKENKIEITGIPIESRFNKKIDCNKVLDDLSFNKENPILLIVGGKLKYNRLLNIIDGIKEKINNAQFIVVAGRDKKLQNQLRLSHIGKDPRVKVFNFVNNLYDYMSVADLILTKAGGLTVAECLAKNLPMIIDGVIPGQEDDNVEYVVKHGAGIKVNGAREAVNVIVDLLNDEHRLAKMKENCKIIAKPHAAKDIVNFIVSKIV